MTLRPNKNRVIIKEIKAETTTRGGIVLPEGSQERASRGTVVAVGCDVTEFSEGDVVIYSHFLGNEFTLEGDKFMSFKDEDLHCVVSDE